MTAQTNRLLSVTDHLSDFSKLVERHLSVVLGTRELENEAAQLIEAEFVQPRLEQFICHVHEWGGSQRQLSRVLRNAKSSHFISTMEALNAIPPRIETAFNTITEIDGLGPSYGSKHLRFLRPDICPILDNMIWEKFKYQWGAKGYRVLQVEVMMAAKILEDNGIYNPMERPQGRWYAADVDMALFAFLNRDRWKNY